MKKAPIFEVGNYLGDVYSTHSIPENNILVSGILITSIPVKAFPGYLGFDLVDSGQSNNQVLQIVYLYKYKLIQSCCRMLVRLVRSCDHERNWTWGIKTLCTACQYPWLNFFWMLFTNLQYPKNNSNLQTLLTFLPDDFLTFNSLCN